MPKWSPPRERLSKPGSRTRSRDLGPPAGHFKGPSQGPLRSSRTRRARSFRSPLRWTGLFGKRGLGSLTRILGPRPLLRGSLKSTVPT
eukprot:11876281-Alexandrium_andersonii.AAC.1